MEHHWNETKILEAAKINGKEITVTAAHLAEDFGVPQADLCDYLSAVSQWIDAMWLDLCFRDWRRSDWKKDPRRYPDQISKKVPIEVWTWEKTIDVATQRIEALEAAAELSDENLPECSEDDRWCRNTCWKVKKAGSDRAMSGGANFRTEEEALGFASTKDCDTDVVFVPGESKRCLDCLVQEVCPQYQMKIDPAW